VTKSGGDQFFGITITEPLGAIIVHMADLPVACTLSPAALKARRENLVNVLWRRAATRHEQPDGYHLRFAAHGDILWVIRTDGRSRTPVLPVPSLHCHRRTRQWADSVDLIGPSGTREFLEAMFEEPEARRSSVRPLYRARARRTQRRSEAIRDEDANPRS
jgi:hypothetical protein